MRNLRSFIVEDDGMGTVEVVLIVLVLVGLVVVFKDSITLIVNQVVGLIEGKVEEATGTGNGNGSSSKFSIFG